MISLKSVWGIKMLMLGHLVEEGENEDELDLAGSFIDGDLDIEGFED